MGFRAVANDEMVQPLSFSESQGHSICCQPTTILAFGGGLVVLVISMKRSSRSREAPPSFQGPHRGPRGRAKLCQVAGLAGKAGDWDPQAPCHGPHGRGYSSPSLS
ncbi:SCO-spondin [Manis javanica]|nr:SCO-spondin [Manis javanica]